MTARIALLLALAAAVAGCAGYDESVTDEDTPYHGEGAPDSPPACDDPTVQPNEPGNTDAECPSGDVTTHPNETPEPAGI